MRKRKEFIKWTEEYYNLTMLKSRGWTDKLINLFLPLPDKTLQNPNYRRAPDMRLYFIEKVLEIESSEEFIIQKEITELRKNSAKKAVKTKTDKIIEAANQFTVVLEPIELDKIYDLAIQSYNDFNLCKGNYDSWASIDSDKEFLNRITVNYLRHNSTPYENRLDDNFGLVGKREAYIIIKNKVLLAIANTYPELKQEAERQMINV